MKNKKPTDPTLRLVQPSLKYQASYVRAVRLMVKDDLGWAKNYSADDLPGQIEKW